MALQLGAGAYLGLGKETTWGTVVTRTVFRPLLSSDLQRKIARAPRPNMVGRLNRIVPAAHFAGIETVEGGFEVEAGYQGIGLLLEHHLGASSSSGAGPYTHTYTLQRGAGTGLTVELGRGADEAASGYRELFEGYRGSRLELVAAVGEVLRLRSQGVAQTAAARDAGSTPTLGTDNPVIPHLHAGTLAWNSYAITINSATLTLDRRLSGRQGFRGGLIGSPAPTGLAEVRLSCVAEIEGDAINNLYNDQLAGDVSNAVLVFTSGTDTMTWTLHNCYLETDTEPVDNAGPLTVRFDLVAQSDASNPGLVIAIANDDASAVAA